MLAFARASDLPLLQDVFDLLMSLFRYLTPDLYVLLVLTSEVGLHQLLFFPIADLVDFT